MPLVQRCHLIARCTRTVALFLVGFSLFASASAQAQDAAPTVSFSLQGKIAERPFVVGYARDISPERVLKYVGNLSKQLSLGESIREELDSELRQESMQHTVPKVSEPLYGFAMYMVSGLIPSFETIAFQKVVDEDDARRLANGRKLQWGDNGIFVDEGNGCFRVEYRNVTTYPLPPGADVAQYEQDISPPSRGSEFKQKVVEKDGVKMIEQSQVISHLFRYHEFMLYEADFDDLFTMQLPSAETIGTSVNATTDLGFKAYLDRIPMGIRQLGWSMFSAAVGSQLQQRDEEQESAYDMRKSSGDLALSVVQTLLFDIDSSDGWARFATADDGSLRGEFRVRARNNSQLTRQLLDAAGNSRFAPILGDTATATFHLCTQLPRDSSLAIDATAVWLTEEMGRSFSNDPGMIAAGEVFKDVLSGISEHRNLELLVKVGWTESSSGVVYGGIQLNDNPHLLKNVHYLLTHLPDAPIGIDQIIALEEHGGMPFIVINIPDDFGTPVREAFGANITHLYLSHQNSCLWFAVGTENAHEMIRQSVARCMENTRAAKTPLISGRFDLERWLSYPQDDPSKITTMLYWLDENASWFPPSPFSLGFTGGSTKPTPIMQQVIDLGGSQQADFSLEADEGGILLQVSLGEALANYMVARELDVQESQNKIHQEQLKKIEEQSRAAAKEALDQLPAPLPPEN